MSAPLFPIFLKLDRRRVLVVGGGPVAAGKTRSLLEAGARVTVVSPEIKFDLVHRNLSFQHRCFRSSDLDDCWFVVSAAPPEVNLAVSAAATERRIFVIAVDDTAHSSAYGAGVVRRSGVTFGISTDGAAPALTGLLREAIDRILPSDLDLWTNVAKEARGQWREAEVPMEERRPLLLKALNKIYEERGR